MSGNEHDYRDLPVHLANHAIRTEFRVELTFTHLVNVARRIADHLAAHNENMPPQALIAQWILPPPAGVESGWTAQSAFQRLVDRQLLRRAPISIDNWRARLADSVALGLLAFGAPAHAKLVAQLGRDPARDGDWLGDSLKFFKGVKTNFVRRKPTKFQLWATVLCANTVGVSNSYIDKILEADGLSKFVKMRKIAARLQEIQEDFHLVEFHSFSDAAAPDRRSRSAPRLFNYRSLQTVTLAQVRKLRGGLLLVFFLCCHRFSSHISPFPSFHQRFLIWGPEEITEAANFDWNLNFPAPDHFYVAQVS